MAPAAYVTAASGATRQSMPCLHHGPREPAQPTTQAHTKSTPEPAPAPVTEKLPARIFHLPNELTDLIVTHLNYHDAVSFRSTCRAASELIPFRWVLHSKRESLKETLLTRERSDDRIRREAWSNGFNWAQYFPATTQVGGPNHGLTNLHDNRITYVDELNCYVCLRTLPRSDFHDTQVMGPRSLGHKEHPKRFCIDCGWRKEIWGRGAVMNRGPRCIVVCRFCGDLNRRADALFRKERICGMKCWTKVMAELERNAELTEKDELEAEQYDGKQGRTPAGHTCTAPRRAKCMRCWSKDHTDSPRWSGHSEFCLDCQIQLGIAGLTINEPSSSTS